MKIDGRTIHIQTWLFIMYVGITKILTNILHLNRFSSLPPSLPPSLPSSVCLYPASPLLSERQSNALMKSQATPRLDASTRLFIGFCMWVCVCLRVYVCVCFYSILEISTLNYGWVLFERTPVLGIKRRYWNGPQQKNTNSHCIWCVFINLWCVKALIWL